MGKKLGLSTFFNILLLVAAAVVFINHSRIENYFYHSSCDNPLPYKIGSVDSRFGISQDQLLADLRKAGGIWSSAEGKNLFVYDPTNDKALSVNLIFDKRQLLNNQINSLENKVGQTDQTLKPEIEQYQKDSATFQQKLSDLNSQISYWNSQGGAPKDVYDQLIATQQSLKAESDSLNQRAQQLNLSTQNFNATVGKLNQTINNFNSTIAQKPEEGLFDPNTNTINIYFDNNSTELIHTLAHEMGHYVGLDHNQNKDSIMYPYTTAAILPSVDDQAALDQVCARKYLFLPHLNLL